jgi:hypothetical protein
MTGHEPGDPFWNVIHTVTRAQLIEDGDLVDVTETAREAGFSIPVAVTRAVWNSCVDWPETQPALQDEAGRLWDVLYMARRAASDAGHNTRVGYKLYVVPLDGHKPEERTLTMDIGPGDEAEPVITILLPNED